MSQWKKIIASSILIQAQTDKAVLIKIPGSKLKFWHPRKCVRTDGKSGYRMTISYTDDFKFNTFRTGEGRHNRSVKIEERAMSVAEIEAAFKVSTEAEAEDEADEADEG